ncbi:hypothetical protein MGU_09089 [Metarhizium guizhouense ARSEF 977]|uniref:Uncharacterized protein n=1 Tax=Metarhizium guizhouense (strain ARSEF 977) TaxID=1276136 RepID=A0A0B4GMA0_METGA|nr:hypothetical protein MGU_09089 [Metarhizium guizhouense ARSEF 977]
MDEHLQIDFSPLCDRDPRVDPKLVTAFDNAVNAEYYLQRIAPSFDEPEGITEVKELVNEHAKKIEFASTSTMSDAHKRTFKDRAEVAYSTPENMRTLSITLLRLGSYVPYTHPGQIFLKEILTDFFLQTEGSQHGQAPEIFRKELLELWSRYRPEPGNSGDDRIKALFQPDEWANFNAFVAIIYHHLDIDYDDFAVQGLGLVLLDSPGSLNKALTADHRALTASAWIDYGGRRLLHLINNSDCLVFNDIDGQEWRLDEPTWELMKDNFATIILDVENDFIYEHSSSMWYRMAPTGQNIN